jgi:hypothetical protein
MLFGSLQPNLLSAWQFGISIDDSLLSMFEQQDAVRNLVTLEYHILDGIFNPVFGC